MPKLSWVVRPGLCIGANPGIGIVGAGWLGVMTCDGIRGVVVVCLQLDDIPWSCMLGNLRVQPGVVECSLAGVVADVWLLTCKVDDSVQVVLSSESLSYLVINAGGELVW